MQWIKDLLTDLRIYFRHGRHVCFLFFLSCCSVIVGSLCSRWIDLPFGLNVGYGGQWLAAWVRWFWPVGLYWVALVVSAFFLLGPAVVYTVQAAACVLLGCSGYAMVSRHGLIGFALHSVLSALTALSLPTYCLLGSGSIGLSSMIRGRMFGNQRGLLFRVEVRRFLIRAAVALLMTLLWTACSAWVQTFIF